MQLEDEALYFVPLGGSEQFGVNLNAYIYDNQILLVDCGIGFADERFPGIDLLLPDPAFLKERKEDIVGLIVTHAHEDHVGAVAYLWERFGCPIYTGEFTAAVLEHKFRDEGLKNVPVKAVDPQARVNIGPFDVQFVSVAHSVPNSFSLIIDTPQGRIVHSGDWNLDPKPVLGAPTDEKTFKDAGAQGVLAYIGDSTNAEVPGRAGSESDVEKGLEKEFKNCTGRIAVTIFSSNIGRVKSIVRAAKKCGRDVGVIGRSLHRMVGVAHSCGYLDDIPDLLNAEDLGFLPDDKVVMIVTGSQGEYRSALAKIARGDHRDVTLNKGDTVIFSSREIPGNERDINAVKNNLTAAGIAVITPRDTENVIHVSGHPCQDEIAEMLGWLRPQIVVPVHGERTQLDAHARFARACQVQNTIIPVNGSLIKLAPGKAETVDHIETGLLAVDMKRIIPADHPSIIARRKLQYTGVIHISIVMDAKGKVVGDLKTNLIGLIDQETAESQIQDRLEDEVFALIDDMTWEERLDDHFVSEELRIGVRRFMVHTLGIKPNTTVHVIRI
ncbi:MAG: ribonuclease J [Alphaproteobacteria bacterium]|nr:ribonuclease J [Alphaproteobacteria bacterium]